jgi:hypothetical protein
MVERELERALGRAPVPLGADHRNALERRLLAEFDRQVPVAPKRGSWLRYATVMLAAATLLITSQAPAELQVGVGKRVTIELRADSPPFEGLSHAVVAAIQARSREHVGEVSMRGNKLADGATLLTIDVWSDDLGTDAETKERVEAVLGMAALRIEVTSLQGRFEDTWLGKVRHLLGRRASPAELERARQRLLEELRLREGAAKIDVDIAGDEAPDGGRHRVRVKLKRLAPTP